jgi:hypothetical protein
MGTRGDARGRTPAVVHTALLAAVVVLVATVALVVRAPSPPSISEFAPQAVKQITKAPDAQSSQFGHGGAGGCVDPVSCQAARSRSRATPTPSPTSGTTVVDPHASVHVCVGDPPRQIQDPQSPPCVAYWKGDNGGATWKGVTATTINVAYPVQLPPSNFEQDIVNFFNDRFELYGRKMVLHPVGAGGVFAGPANPTTMHSTAVAADQEQHAFASLSYPTGAAQGQDSYYYDELARRGILSVSSEESFRTEAANYDKPGLEGYEWSFQPTLDELEADTAVWACTSLAGKLPVKAGQPFYPGTPVTPAAPRRFGIVQATNYGAAADISRLRQGLRACNINPMVLQIDAGANDAQAQGVAVKLQQDKVSTVICVCFQYEQGNLQKNSANSNYLPEWLNLGNESNINDDNGLADHLPQVDRTFGLYSRNKLNQVSQEPYFWAVKAEDPQADTSGFANSRSLGDPFAYTKFYESMLMLAAGIQLAGPRLTPATFRAGLLGAQFPNPGAGGPPYYQGSVSMGPGDHSFLGDVTMTWFDRNAVSPATARPGRWCFYRLGVRLATAHWRPVPAEQLPDSPSTPCA